MATNLIQAGDVMPWTNGTGADVASGDFIAFAASGGIALVDIANGETGSVALSGVAGDIAKKATEAFAQGAVLYWDATNKQLTTTATDNTVAGTAFRAAAAADTVGEVRLG